MYMYMEISLLILGTRTLYTKLQEKYYSNFLDQYCILRHAAANTFKLILYHHAFYMYLHGLAYTFSGSMAVIVVMKASTSPQLPSSPPPPGFGGHLPTLEMKTWCRQASTNQVRSRFRERKRDLTYCELERERERERERDEATE